MCMSNVQHSIGYVRNFGVITRELVYYLQEMCKIVRVY